MSVTDTLFERVKMRKKYYLHDNPLIRLQNVVTSASLNHGIDINAVHKIFPRTWYRPESFLGLVFRLKRPKTATLIFRSRKMVCTGPKRS